jgi:hypothetical protein
MIDGVATYYASYQAAASFVGLLIAHMLRTLLPSKETAAVINVCCQRMHAGIKSKVGMENVIHSSNTIVKDDG